MPIAGTPELPMQQAKAVVYAWILRRFPCGSGLGMLAAAAALVTGGIANEDPFLLRLSMLLLISIDGLEDVHLRTILRTNSLDVTTAAPIPMTHSCLHFAITS